MPYSPPISVTNINIYKLSTIHAKEMVSIFHENLSSEFHRTGSASFASQVSPFLLKLSLTFACAFKKMFAYPSMRESHLMYPVYALNNSGSH